MQLSVIIPTRGNERRQFVEHQLKQMSLQTFQPHEVIVVDHPPTDSSMDLGERMRRGVLEATGTHIAVIEDDDYYPNTWLASLRWVFQSTKAQVTGMDYTIYYNLHTQNYKTMHHPGRASWFTTAFTRELGESYRWPTGTPWIDIEFWAHVNREGIPHEFVLPPTNPIGIKHGIGKTGGNGHSLKWRGVKDQKYRFLKSKLNTASFNFYMGLL